ncbi:MAG: hypothetical protein ACT4OT_18675 [Acidobacteriota bacterium]
MKPAIAPIVTGFFAIAVTLIASNCAKPTPPTCIFVAQKDGKVQFYADRRGGSAPNITAPVPGRVVAFRATQAWGTGVVSTGEVGKLYRIDQQFSLEQIGTFDTSLSDSDLLARYGEPCPY